MLESSDTLIFVHRLIGYSTAFIIAPFALLAFANPVRHREWGKIYFCVMLFLYLTGSWFTFTRHSWVSWNFYRNLTFNFFGFSMVLYAYRAIRLFKRPGPVAPDRLDRSLAMLLTGSVVALFSVAVWKNTPMRTFTILGAVLCIMEWKDLGKPWWQKTELFRRHVRYIIASYFYVLTVVSVVHLGDELPQNVKWLWPLPLGVFAGWMLTAPKTAWPFRGPLGRIPQGRLTRYTVWAIIGVSTLFGSYVVYDLLYGSALRGQG